MCVLRVSRYVLSKECARIQLLKRDTSLIKSEKGETASRLRGRIEKVLDAAKAKGFRVDKKIWTVPANRMKAGREHRVPITSL